MLVELSDIRVTEQYAAAAVGLQSVFVRVDNDRINVAQTIERSSCFVAQLAGQSEIATIGGIGMDPGTVLAGEVENRRQAIHGPKPGIANCGNDGAYVTGL